MRPCDTCGKPTTDSMSHCDHGEEIATLRKISADVIAENKIMRRALEAIQREALSFHAVRVANDAFDQIDAARAAGEEG